MLDAVKIERLAQLEEAMAQAVAVSESAALYDKPAIDAAEEKALEGLGAVRRYLAATRAEALRLADERLGREA